MDTGASPQSGTSISEFIDNHPNEDSGPWEEISKYGYDWNKLLEEIRDNDGNTYGFLAAFDGDLSQFALTWLAFGILIQANRTENK